jgi:signal transduction histidine kinase
MTSGELQQKLSDLIGFQCVLVALRGVSAEASEEMLWQSLVSELVEQYGLRRVWYGRHGGSGLDPVVLVQGRSLQLEELTANVEATSSLVTSAGLVVPVLVEGVEEGKLLLYAEDKIGTERAEQICILTSEAATMIAERRARLRNEQALKQAKLEAESASRSKSLLLANMSHEIRTPMAGVLGFADLLARTPLSAEQRDYVETIRSSGEVLLTLINDILDFSKIGSGKLQLETLPLDIRGVVEKVMSLLRVQATEKHLCVFSVIDPAAPEVILGDAVRLRQILMNLVGNAIKFTSQGEVSLTVGSRSFEGCRRLLEFIVRDTGPGIASENHTRIFEAFSQVDASISRKHGGTGLGLAISMALAKQMDGSLWVESELGNGAAFHFSLVAQAVSPAAGPGSPRDSVEVVRELDTPALRVIVADDNRVNSQAMLAVQMPELDGLETTRRIRRELPPESQPYIIAVTAAAFPEDRMRCLEAGMNDYLAKPVDLAELTNALRRARPPIALQAGPDVPATSAV